MLVVTESCYAHMRDWIFNICLNTSLSITLKDFFHSVRLIRFRNAVAHLVLCPQLTGSPQG